MYTHMRAHTHAGAHPHTHAHTHSPPCALQLWAPMSSMLAHLGCAVGYSRNLPLLLFDKEQQAVMSASRSPQGDTIYLKMYIKQTGNTNSQVASRPGSYTYYLHWPCLAVGPKGRVCRFREYRIGSNTPDKLSKAVRSMWTQNKYLFDPGLVVRNAMKKDVDLFSAGLSQTIHSRVHSLTHTHAHAHTTHALTWEGTLFGGSILIDGSHSPGGNTVTWSRNSSMPATKSFRSLAL